MKSLALHPFEAAFNFLTSNEQKQHHPLLLASTPLSAHRTSKYHNGEGLVVQVNRDFMAYKKVTAYYGKTHGVSKDIVIPIIIEKGSVVRITKDLGKMRSTHAIWDGTYVESGTTNNPVLKLLPKDTQVRSYMYAQYPYVVGANWPTNGTPEDVVRKMQQGNECGPGIHFFLQLEKARNF